MGQFIVICLAITLVAIYLAQSIGEAAEAFNSFALSYGVSPAVGWVLLIVAVSAVLTLLVWGILVLARKEAAYRKTVATQIANELRGDWDIEAFAADPMSKWLLDSRRRRAIWVRSVPRKDWIATEAFPDYWVKLYDLTLAFDVKKNAFVLLDKRSSRTFFARDIEHVDRRLSWDMPSGKFTCCELAVQLRSVHTPSVRINFLPLSVRHDSEAATKAREALDTWAGRFEAAIANASA